MPYYTPTDIPAFGRARSDTLDQNFNDIKAAFDSLPTAVELKNYTGNFGTDTGTANAYVVTLPYTPTAYAGGQEIVFIPANNNTGASTVNVNSLGVKDIVRQDETALQANDLAGIVTLRYNATLGKFMTMNAIQGQTLSALMSSLNSSANAAAAMDVLSGLQHINSITSLKGINPVAGRVVYLKYHTTQGDGGHGVFEALTTGGLYLDDDGVTIVPTGGDGSSCWRRRLDGFVTPEMFGGDVQAAGTYAAQSKLQLLAGTYSITAALELPALVLEGTGAFGPTGTGGSVIDNTTNDVEAIIFDGSTTRVDRARVRDLRINHEAATKYAVHFNAAPFSDLENVEIECGGTGFGGILYGDEVSPSATTAYLGGGRNVRIWNYTDYGVRVNSTGTLWNFTGWHVSSTVNGAIGGYFNKEGVQVIGGQWGGNNTGGIAIADYNIDSGDRPGSLFDGQLFEAVSNYCISFDGATNSVVGGIAKNSYANLVSVTGTVVYFGRAKKCRFEAPRVTNPTLGGTLCEWSANSLDCVLECNYDAATAPITVHASATRAVKIVTGKLTLAQVANVTTDANLTTVLRDGVVGLPNGFVPVHNGVAWNFSIKALADDAAVAITPPNQKGMMRVINNDEAATFGIAVYNADATTPECEAIAAGSAFAATTGALAGTTGANLFVTVSAHTDGDVYVEARKGAATITVLFDPNGF